MPREVKRYIKSNINKLAIALFVYELIFQLGSTVFIQFGTGFFQDENFAMIASSSMALLSSYLILGKPKSPEQERKKLPPLRYVLYVFIIFGMQLLAIYLTLPIELWLENRGFSLDRAAEIAAGGTLLDPLNFLYAVLLAPLFEELLFRGFLYGELRKFGRIFAIFISALLFALMHLNILQFLLALFVGIFFAYIRENYGLRNSILLHASNNALALLLNNCKEDSTLFLLFYSLLSYGGFVLFLSFTIRNFRVFREQLQAERSFPYMLLYFFTSVCMLILLLSFIALSALNLS